MDLNLRQRAVPDWMSVTEASLQAAWDDGLLPRVNGEVFELGSRFAFRARRMPVRLRAGADLRGAPGSAFSGGAGRARGT